MIPVPTGSRELFVPGSPYNRDGQQAGPLLVHLGEPFTEVTPPSLDEPTDETWMRLDPVERGDGLLPITYSTTLIKEPRHDPWSILPRWGAPPAPEDYVQTLGPFISPRFVLAARAHQHRRLSLTVVGGDEDNPVRWRWFDVQLALDVDLRHVRGPGFWLDWMVHPVDGTDVYAMCVSNRPVAEPA